MSAAAKLPVEEKDATLAELLDRVERGEAVTISRHGRLVARLVPTATHDVSAAQDAVDAIWKLREQIRLESGPITTEEILELIHEGRKY